MPIVNALKKQVDLPVWEWTRFAPAVSSALSASCAAAGSAAPASMILGRYIYYLISATAFWRYDTVTDTYTQLASPPIATATWVNLEMCAGFGHEGLVLAASSTTLTIPGYFGQAMKGYDVLITAGTGAGQRRSITSVAEPVAADSGVVTAVTNTQGTLNITDTTKAWAINQWAGYNVRFVGNTGVGQVRRILYNTATQLVLGDSALAPQTIFNNPAITSPAINATAGTQALYSIESSVATVDSAWLVTPDTTSQFRVRSGMILLASSAAATPFYTLQNYDVLTDTWYIRTANSANIAVVGTDGSLERTGEVDSVWERGTASADSTTTTLVDNTKSWFVDQWVGYYVRIHSGTGEDELRQITANTSTTLTWVTVATQPDATSVYQIEGFDAGTATAGSTTTLTDSGKAWETNRWANYAVRITGGTGKGQVAPIASNTGTVITLNRAFTTAPDTTSTYLIVGDNDKAYIMLGANAGVLIQNLDDDLGTYGMLADSGVARNGSAQVGSQKPVGIASLSNATTTATVTTTLPHMFKAGQSVIVRGATDANFNGTFTIATVPSTTTFTYTMGGTPAGTSLANAQSTTTLSDASKSWSVNQWAGYVVYLTTTAVTAATGAATGVAMQIASNTATTLTFVAATTAPTTGISRYVIATRKVLGADATTMCGIATGSQSTTTLQDTSKTWVVNQWAGKRVKFLSGTGQGQELLITSNTANTLTFGVATAPVAGATSYAILDQPVRGVGTHLLWAAGTSDLSYRGKYLFSPRGGAASGFDRLDLTTGRWSLMATSPTTETLTTGSQYAYDGVDCIFFAKDATQRIYCLNVVTNTVEGGSQFPYVAPTAVIGNRMEIFTTEDGLKYLWINRASFTECYRCLLFWNLPTGTTVV